MYARRYHVCISGDIMLYFVYDVNTATPHRGRITLRKAYPHNVKKQYNFCSLPEVKLMSVITPLIKYNSSWEPDDVFL